MSMHIVDEEQRVRHIRMILLTMKADKNKSDHPLQFLEVREFNVKRDGYLSREQQLLFCAELSHYGHPRCPCSRKDGTTFDATLSVAHIEVRGCERCF